MLKHSLFEVELKKYSVVGILNIPYLLNEEEEKEQIDSQISITALIDALASIEQLNRIDHLNMWDIQTDIQELYKKCFAQFPTILNEEEVKNNFTLASIIPEKTSRDTALKMINSIIAVGALVLRNHIVLKQSLNKYKYQFGLGGIWEKIQKEIVDIFRTIVKIQEEVRESVAVDMLCIDEKDSTYSSLIASILELNTYHFPFLYSPITTYLSQFHTFIQEGTLFTWIESFTLQFIEILKNDACKMFSACMSSNDAFRYNKSTDTQFLCCSVLNSNFNVLLEMKAALPESYYFYIVEIAINMITLFFKELNSIMDKQAKDSRYYSLFLEDSDIFKEIRLDSMYEQIRLNIPMNLFNDFCKMLGYIYEKKGKLEQTETDFLKFNAVGKSSFIGESAKVLYT